MITLEYIRQFRIFGYALFDLGISFLAVYLLAPLASKLFTKIHVQISRKSWLFLTIPIAVMVHLIFGKMTLMTKNFLDIHGHYFIKVVILLLLILGVKDIGLNKKK